MALIGVSICDLKNVSAKVDKLVGKERNGEDKSKFYIKRTPKKAKNSKIEHLV